MYHVTRPRSLLVFLLILLSWTLAGCGAGSDTTAPVSLEMSATPGERPAARLLTPAAMPSPLSFPRDDAPHDALTEWWYVTGHLQAADGHRYGFEFVIFQSRRADLSPAYAAHFAVTDVDGRAFHYDERAQVGGGPPRSAVPFTLDVGGWTLRDDGSRSRISAEMAGYRLDLGLRSTKPPALHNRVGYFQFVPGFGSYYYSRTRIDASGTLAVAGKPLTVSGQAWMDHQWGNFLVPPSGGWDWFSIQLDDGRDLMIWQSRAADNRVIYGSATLVEADGTAEALRAEDVEVVVTGRWESPHSGAIYPSGWTIKIPSKRLQLTLRPLVEDQELQTPRSTRITYWEGDVEVSGRSGAQPIHGRSYVELTGYAFPQ